MARYGHPRDGNRPDHRSLQADVAEILPDELDTGATKANAQVGRFIFSTILGVPIPGRPPVTDERARATLAIFWAKTRMHWKETNVHEHSGKRGDAIEVSTVRERITRRLARLAAESTTNEDPEEF